MRWEMRSAVGLLPADVMSCSQDGCSKTSLDLECQATEWLLDRMKIKRDAADVAVFEAPVNVQRHVRKTGTANVVEKFPPKVGEHQRAFIRHGISVKYLRQQMFEFAVYDAGADHVFVVIDPERGGHEHFAAGAKDAGFFLQGLHRIADVLHDFVADDEIDRFVPEGQ